MTRRQTEKIEEANQAGGERRVVEVIKTPVTREDGEVVGLMGTFTDITFRRRTEEALDRERDPARHGGQREPDGRHLRQHGQQPGSDGRQLGDDRRQQLQQQRRLVHAAELPAGTAW